MIELGSNDIARLNWFGLKRAIAAILASPPVNPVVRTVARALPARIGRRLPVAVHHVNYRLASGKTVRLLDPLRDILARDIYWGGGQVTDPAEVHKLRCIEALSKQARTFLDIGTYAGFFALLAARSNPEIKAICYEIVPENYNLTIRNILANDLADRVEVRLCGIGEVAGTIRLPLSMKAASNLMSISLGAMFSKGIAVPVATLDDETRHLRGPFLVKIDVEGFEAQVFKGGAKFIRKERPTIICEILPGDELPILPPDYRTFAFEPEGPVERPLDLQAKPREWLFLPAEHQGSVFLA